MLPCGEKRANIMRESLLTGLLMVLFFFANAQDIADSAEHVVTAREWNFNIEINTSGAGLWFQKGWTPDYYNKHFVEVGAVYNRHPKAVRVKSALYNGATSFCYGKLCDLFLVRLGYGYQRTLHHKPYWGGVSIRYTLSAGLSVGLVFPTYLKVVDMHGYVHVEKYDPETVDAADILGHAPFWTNLSHISYPRPGFYGKTGLIFDFSKKDLAIHALEIGVCLDMIFPYVQQMAFNKAKPFYFAAYLSYDIGKKKRVFD
jgi:hypothetical protein